MRRGILLVLVPALFVAACGSATSEGTPDPQTATVVDGRFELRFTVDRVTLKPEDDITGTAELRMNAGGSGALSGSSQLFGFEFAEVGGEHRIVTPVYTADCAPHQVGSDSPLTTPIVKSGGTVGDGPNDAFVRDFLEGRAIHLPAGQWDITAIAGFIDGRSCSGQPHTIRATVRVTVAG